MKTLVPAVLVMASLLASCSPLSPITKEERTAVIKNRIILNAGAPSAGVPY